MHIITKFLVILASVLAILLAIGLSLRIWAFVADEPFDMTFVAPQWGWFVVLPLLWFVLASASDFYRLSVAASRMASLQRLTLITLQMLILYVVVFFFSDRDALPRLFIIYYGVSSFLLIMLWRLVNPALIGWTTTPRRALIVGTDWTAETIIDTLKAHAPDSYRLIGVIGSGEIPDQVRGLEGGPGLRWRTLGHNEKTPREGMSSHGVGNCRRCQGGSVAKQGLSGGEFCRFHGEDHRSTPGGKMGAQLESALLEGGLNRGEEPALQGQNRYPLDRDRALECGTTQGNGPPL